MATLSYTVSAVHQPSVKGLKVKLVKIVGDTDIPAAATGYVVTCATLGMNFVTGGQGGPSRDGVYFVTVTPLGASGARIRFFNVDDGVEAAAGENGVDGTIANFIVYGY